MTKEPSSPLNFTVSTTKSDDRTWLHLKRSDGASAALSCQTSHDSGETIASQVVTEFAEALSEAADALEDGVTVTDEMVERFVDAHQPDRIQGFHYRPNYVIRDVSLPMGKQVIWRGPDDEHGGDHDAFQRRCEIERVRAALRAALSAPAQRVEEGPRMNPDEIHEYVEGYEWRHDNGGGYTPTDAEKAMIEDAINGFLAASPAPAPHAGIEITEGMVTVALAEFLGGSSRKNVRRALRAALGDHT